MNDILWGILFFGAIILIIIIFDRLILWYDKKNQNSIDPKLKNEMDAKQEKVKARAYMDARFLSQGPYGRRKI